MKTVLTAILIGQYFENEIGLKYHPSMAIGTSNDEIIEDAVIYGRPKVLRIGDAD